MNINKSSEFTAESLEVVGYRGSPDSGKVRFLVNGDLFDAKERFKGQPEDLFLAHGPMKGRNAELEVIKGNYSVGLYYPNGSQILGPTDAPIFFRLSLSESEIVKDKIATYEKNQKLFRDLWDRADSSNPESRFSTEKKLSVSEG